MHIYPFFFVVVWLCLLVGGLGLWSWSPFGLHAYVPRYVRTQYDRYHKRKTAQRQIRIEYQAIGMAQFALYFVILTPTVSDQIMLLEGFELGPSFIGVNLGNDEPNLSKLSASSSTP